MNFDIISALIGLAVGAIVFGILCFVIGYNRRKSKAESIIGSAEQEQKRILSEALRDAEAKKKEAVLNAKDEIHKLRSDADKDIRERRKEVQRQEQRIAQKEETLDKKTDNLEAKEEKLNKRIKEAEDKNEEAEELKKRQFEILEKISGFSKDQARDYLLKAFESELDHEKALKLAEYERQYREESEDKAKEIVSQAIQRCAADHSSEITVSVVSLPSEEMKGRIIGREGRNIRSIETATGVDLIIDDTPEAITVSCFNPVQREIAPLALEKLIADGRIHPARIEEMVQKAKKEVDHTIKKEGERAVLELGIHSINPELVKLIGKLHYRTSYGQNILNHSMEVAYLSGLMASELGADVTLARRAGLLHDIGKAVDKEKEGTHIALGVEEAKRYRENEEVIHAIASHHGDIETKTVIAAIVQAADAISAARPGARKENIESYIKRLEKLEEIANSFEGVEQSFAIQAGREVRIMVNPKTVDDDKMALIAHEIAQKIESELDYPGQVKVNMIRESRVEDYAK